VRIGAHQSVAGGLWKGIEAARRDGCEAVQIFTRNQVQWRSKPLGEEVVCRFRDAVAAWRVPRERLLAHDSYLVNLASPDPSLWRRSLAVFRDELERCARFGVGYLVMHPGAHMGDGEARAVERVARGLNRALEGACDGAGAPRVLLETTSGQGTTLGHRFEHLRDLLAGIAPADRVGVCVDTCHVHAAGYDLVSEEGIEATLAAMQRSFGLDRVWAFHLNDSKRERGSRVDRHERVGRGRIGRALFRRLLNEPRFANLPAVLELPPPYPPQLARLRRLANGNATARRRPAARTDAGGRVRTQRNQGATS
jgi:deoxyribonuclease-4